ncbi:hypothetical protein RI129_009282 [Pyrocoelia pectoralis]|uniref:DNA-directed DNA polymerase n=1 Tax=Pyrocoelia pectoralis TaxID=417401 RepID=A0AAN7V1H7_9COLE
MNPTTFSSLSDRVVKVTAKALLLLKTKDEIVRHICIVRKNIHLIRKFLRSELNKNENSLKLESNLALLKSFLVKLKQLKRGSEKRGGGISNRKKLVWQTIDSCFKDRLLTGIVVNFEYKDPVLFLEKAFDSFSRKISTTLERSLLKVNTVLVCNFIQAQNQVIDLKTFVTKSQVIDVGTDLKQWYDTHVISKIRTKIEEFAEKDSGWSLYEILHLKININSYSPLKGGISTYVKVPHFIAIKRAVINVQNNDNCCFLWAVVSALYPAQTHSERTSSYPHYSEVLKYDSIQFPIKISDIKKFEKLNNLRINLYCLKGKNVVPFLLSENQDREPINLLALACNESARDHTYLHFTWIKNMSALFSKQLSKHGRKKFICNRCLNHFSSNAYLQKHLKHCNDINKCATRLPDETNKYLQFKHLSYQEKVPFVVYADLESILEKCPDNQNTNTRLCDKHIPFSVAYYLKCSYNDELSKFRLYRGRDCIQWFVKELHDIATWANEIVGTVVPMETLSKEQMESFQNATVCHICNKPFQPGDIKVRDHSHFTSKFRNAAHQNCNLNYKDTHVIPVVFHNLSGYDSHFIIRELALKIPGQISLLPLNKEKYISFSKSVENTKIKFRFIDSFRFMASSIDKLSSYLDNEKKIITKLNCSNGDEFNLLVRKGIFPYEYVDSWDKLDESSLPPKEAFYSHLHEEGISDESYTHANKVWTTFHIQTLGQYSDLYLKTDVLLLADIFENFRLTCLNAYQLDPLHYYTAPGLAFDAMLKITEVKLELLTDIDMAMFIERGIRGGVAQCSNRYAKANNKYMDYDPSAPTSFLMYYDVNNLYGKSMGEFLPYGEFSFVDELNIDSILNNPDDSDIGYIIDCDLDYPPELHESHSDLPLAPEHMTPPSSNSKLKKLLLTLYSKRNYVLHYRNLKLYLEQGLRLVKVNQVLRFKQSPWLKKYIDLNTTLRQASKNDFDKNFYKLMINSVFGKLMENVRKYKDVRLVTKWEGRFGARSLIAQPNFHSCTIFDKDMVIIEMNKLEVFMNKPIYAGFSVLDLSKTFLYDFHYNYILKKFQNNAQLLYTDTDSLIYSFAVPDIYECIKEDIDRFDTSDYERDNVYGIPLVNKKVPGLMKDENNGKIMLEFVGLRAKMYAYSVEGKVTKKSKGSTAASVKQITIEDYKKALFNYTIAKRCQRLIRSKKHLVFTIKQDKVVLSPYDDKRVRTFGSTNTRPWGFSEARI